MNNDIAISSRALAARCLTEEVPAVGRDAWIARNVPEYLRNMVREFISDHELKVSAFAEYVLQGKTRGERHARLDRAPKDMRPYVRAIATERFAKRAITTQAREP